MKMDIAKVGAVVLDADTGMPSIQVVSEILSAESAGVAVESESSGVQMFQASGVSSMPYPAETGSWCEVVRVRNISGLDTIAIGFRDSRTSTIYGSLNPGDTALHTTGPGDRAKVLLKQEEYQAAVMVRTDDGVDHVMVIDGDGEEFSISAFGMLISMKKTVDGGQIVLANSNGSFGLKPNGHFFANTPGGSLGAAATPANGIAHSVAGPINLMSASWSVSPT
jgi:hypothetical protein